MIKRAWVAQGTIYGSIYMILATPLIKTTEHSYGYSLTSDLDEVFRLPLDDELAQSIIRRLTKTGPVVWIDGDNLIEESFDLDDYFEERIYQEVEDYNREVIFHTHDSLINSL